MSNEKVLNYYLDMSVNDGSRFRRNLNELKETINGVYLAKDVVSSIYGKMKFELEEAMFDLFYNGNIETLSNVLLFTAIVSRKCEKVIKTSLVIPSLTLDLMIWLVRNTSYYDGHLETLPTMGYETQSHAIGLRSHKAFFAINNDGLRTKKYEVYDEKKWTIVLHLVCSYSTNIDVSIENLINHTNLCNIVNKIDEKFRKTLVKIEPKFKYMFDILTVMES